MPEVRPPELGRRGPENPPSRGCEWIPHGYRLESHSHPEGQLVWAATGVMATTTRRGTWVAPSHRMTWTPPGFKHSHRFYGRTDARVLAVPVEFCGELAPESAVFAMSAVLREAMLALTERLTFRPRAEMHLMQVVADELADVAEIGEDSLYLLEPHGDRLRAVTEALHADPAQSMNLAELGRAAGASDRTLSRLFQKELGMSFHRWRTTRVFA